MSDNTDAAALSLVALLRSRGSDFTSHPVANGSIGCTEEAGELLIRAANALEAALAQQVTEPAAYRYKDARGHWRYVGAPLSAGWGIPPNLGHEPLYAAAPTAPAPKEPQQCP